MLCLLGEDKKKREMARVLFSQDWRPDMPCWLCHAVFSQLLGVIKGQS
jgi:hypothetical protein